MKKVIGAIIGLVVVLLAIASLDSFYILDETEQAVITQFGRPVGGSVTEPGLRWKMPYVQKATKFKKHILEWDGQREQIPTNNKTFIWVDAFARWRIVDPLTFYEKLRDVSSAQQALDGIIDAAVRNLVTSYDLIETVRTTDRKIPRSESALAMDLIPSSSVDSDTGDTIEIDTELSIGRAGMLDQVHEQAGKKLREFGIELVDVRFKRLNYVDDVLQKVYDRMKEERRQIAEKLRSEGRGESQKILGKKERELKRIYSEAYRRSEEVKGHADAEATRIYSSAYNRDPEFYSFVKTMDLYKQSLDSTTWTIFSTDADFLKYLKRYDGK